MIKEPFVMGQDFAGLNSAGSDCAGSDHTCPGD
jgi:hypothetical protein